MNRLYVLAVLAGAGVGMLGSAGLIAQHRSRVFALINSSIEVVGRHDLTRDGRDDFIVVKRYNVSGDARENFGVLGYVDANDSRNGGAIRGEHFKPFYFKGDDGSSGVLTFQPRRIDSASVSSDDIIFIRMKQSSDKVALINVGQYITQDLNFFP